MLCLLLPISAIADNTENAEPLMEAPAVNDLKFAELLATRAVPAIFATGAAFETAFYYGNSAALPTVSRERTMELQQAAGLIRNVKISEEYEPIRTEFLSKLDTLLYEVREGGSLKQGCSKCVADIKRMKEYSQNFGVWTIESISKIS